ncbi:MAG: hypothetical protein V4459_10445 [Pseudomonadota bacterium]
MIERLSGTLGVLAIGRLSLAAALGCALPPGIAMPICGEGHRWQVIPTGGKAPAHDNASAGCHALCGRKHSTDNGEDFDC